jgi:Arc/MetJ-type ribon-helix-helix transcriptional regulator
MTITLQPHQEQAIEAAIRSGRFRSVDEFIDDAIAHLPEPVAGNTHVAKAGDLVELFEPVRGLLTDDEIDVLFSRNPSAGRPVDLV